MDYVQQIEQDRLNRLASYTKLQNILLEKLKNNEFNMHGFEVYICDPNDDINKVNTDRGFFTVGYIIYKKVRFAVISPEFTQDSKSIEYLYMTHFPEALYTVNYSNDELDLPILEFKKKHHNLQSCIDTLEEIRKAIANFYTI